MGFGTLFIGYFLLLNLTYYGFSDVVAAAVMLLGLYKLAKVNKPFEIAAIGCTVFLAFAFCEFGIATYELFFKRIDSSAVISVVGILRSLIIGTFTYFTLKGIVTIAKEVELENVPKKASRLSIATIIIYALWTILQLPLPFMSDYILFATIVGTLVLIVMNLTVIYNCYMRICMPGDEDMKDKPSRFAFVNEYRARQAQREAEAMAKRMKQLKNRANKKKGKKK